MLRHPNRRAEPQASKKRRARAFTEVFKITALLSGIEESLNKARQQNQSPCKIVLTPEQHAQLRKNISSQALSVVEILQRHGYMAYLVGGCIRDLLIGKQPKDFDVSTNATPDQVRRVFRNSRIIGRRFKIVHVVFGKDIVEVTTFRSGSDAAETDAGRVSSDSGMLVRDNVYGTTIEEDADRRDFSINAVYYDSNEHALLDFHGGLTALKDRVIDIIGDPGVRYHEDPVRMIRALRFAAKLGFKITKRTAEPIRKLRGDLKLVSSARMFDEVSKLFLTGHGLESFRILKEYHIFEILFPQLESFLGNRVFNEFVEYALTSSDERFASSKRNMPHFLYAVLFWLKFQSGVFRLQQLNEAAVDPVPLRVLTDQAGWEILRAQSTITAIPMGISASILSMWALQLQLLETKDPALTGSVVSQSLFRGAFDILRLRARFEPYLVPCMNFWQPYYDKSASRSRSRPEKGRLKDKDKGRRSGKYGRSSQESAFRHETSAEKNDRLARARAWRAAMNLEP